MTATQDPCGVSHTPESTEPRLCPARCQFCRVCSQGSVTFRSDVCEYRRHIRRKRRRVYRYSRKQRRSTFPARRQLAAPFVLPSLTRRALATANASLVRREIAARLPWATSAMMPMVRSFAPGISTAPNRTPLSQTANRNAAVLPSRSSFAVTSVAPVIYARCSALVSSGRSALCPLSTLLNSGRTSARPEASKSSITLRRASRPRSFAPWRAVQTRLGATSRCPAAIFTPSTKHSLRRCVLQRGAAS